MDTKDMNPEAQQAIASVKMADLRKQINAASWNENMENLMKKWGEKAAGLRFMHDNALVHDRIRTADRAQQASVFAPKHNGVFLSESRLRVNAQPTAVPHRTGEP